MKYLLILLFLFTLPGAQARDRPFLDEQSADREDVEDPTYWSEGNHVMPPYPQAEDLLEYNVDDPDSPLRYYLDAKHLEVGEDQVVRFTLVIKGQSGGWNVSYAGVRCNLPQIKTYAYGTGRGELRALKAPRWEKIKRNRAFQYYRDLRDYYLCRTEEHVPFSRPEILRRLQTAPSRTEDTGFF